MRFYQSGLESIVWDPENDCALAEFKNGAFETKNKKVIAKLKELGYKTSGPEPDDSEDFEQSADQGRAKPRVSRLKE